MECPCPGLFTYGHRPTFRAFVFLGRNHIMSKNFLAAAGLAALAIAAPASAETLVERGQYLAHIMDCGGCHHTGAFTPQPNLETPLAGSDIGFEMPGMGGLYPPNQPPE